MKDDAEEPTVVWEGCIERKCKLADASETPSKAVRLRDDATGETDILPFINWCGNTEQIPEPSDSRVALKNLMSALLTSAGGIHPKMDLIHE